MVCKLQREGKMTDNYAMHLYQPCIFKKSSYIRTILALDYLHALCWCIEIHKYVQLLWLIFPITEQKKSGSNQPRSRCRFFKSKFWVKFFTRQTGHLGKEPKIVETIWQISWMGLCDSSWQFLRTKAELATRSRDLVRIPEQRMSWDLQQHQKGPAGMLLAAILYLWSLWLPGAAGNSPSSPQHVIILMQVGKKGCRNQRHWQCPWQVKVR